MLNRLPQCLVMVAFAFVAPASVLADRSFTPQTAASLESGQPVRVVCFGDSVTGVYYHTGSRRAYTDMLGIALKKIYPKADVTTINAGISGHTTINGLARIDSDVLAHKPSLVTVMFGLNDMTRVPLDQYRANLKTIIDKCRAVGAEVLLCTPNNVISTPGRPTEKLIQYCQAVRQVGLEKDLRVLDCYQQLEALRKQSPTTWRMFMSDAIHPNMNGHKRIAELMALAISGEPVALANVGPPEPALVRTTARIKQKQAINVLAMTPVDKLIKPALEKLGEVQVNITAWDVTGKTLAEIEADAKARVRAMKPDLVVIAVPRSATAKSEEALIHSYAWIMNWSLNFGPGGWDCLVVDPAVLEPDSSDQERDQMTRRLVGAQDLHLITREPGDARSAQTLLENWFQQQR